MSNKRADKILKIAIVLALIGLAVWSRFVPHPANFTALTAVALFGGAMLPRQWAFIVPIGAMILSDLFIGFHSLSIVVWLSFALAVLIGRKLYNQRTVMRIAGASLMSSTAFFIITNFAVWAEGRMYGGSLDQLVLSYVNAIPFYRNMIVGDLLYTGVLFGAYALVTYTAGYVWSQRRHMYAS
ncbi:hypothetical protein EOL73_01425 [Candidatus Saccharibacteria bacterium]|nr:hypothetical protein [Candidatus Saccharibacteria bacterium]NCU40396.1 hypothetical protein [Candidatus Saccharibacteria bacterium]